MKIYTEYKLVNSCFALKKFVYSQNFFETQKVQYFANPCFVLYIHFKVKSEAPF